MWDIRPLANDGDVIQEISLTVDYAFENSASVPSPADGETCYVLEKGESDFAGQGGRLGT